MRRDLEASRPVVRPAVPYALSSHALPFALQFARRRSLSMPRTQGSGATQSDGQTSGNDGGGGDNDEEFDWLDDD